MGAGSVGSKRKFSTIEGRGTRKRHPWGFTGIYSVRAQHGQMVTGILLTKIQPSIAYRVSQCFNSYHECKVTEAPIPNGNSSKTSRSVRNVSFLSSYSFLGIMVGSSGSYWVTSSILDPIFPQGPQCSAWPRSSYQQKLLWQGHLVNTLTFPVFGKQVINGLSNFSNGASPKTLVIRQGQQFPKASLLDLAIILLVYFHHWGTKSMESLI